MKYPQTFQRPQHTQPPRSATNHNSGRPNLLDQAKLGRLYKPARSSISKESTTRSRRDNFSGSNLSFTGLQRSHRDYFSGSPSGQINKNVTSNDPYRDARTAVSKRSGPAQTPPCAALPDDQPGYRSCPARSHRNLPHSTCGPSTCGVGHLWKYPRAVGTQSTYGFAQQRT